jgi:carboxylesterase
MQCTPPDTAAACLLAAEADLFLKEYQQHYSAGETKPNRSACRFSARARIRYRRASDSRPDGRAGRSQGVGGVSAQKGLTVYAPRLAGHGTSCKDLSTRRYEDWLDSAERGHAILKKYCDKILVAGFSTGAGLALQSVILKPHDFEAVIAVSAPLKFKSFSSRFAEVLNAFNRFCHSRGVNTLARDYIKNDADNPHINYLLLSGKRICSGEKADEKSQPVASGHSHSGAGDSGKKTIRKCRAAKRS